MTRDHAVAFLNKNYSPEHAKLYLEAVADEELNEDEYWQTIGTEEKLRHDMDLFVEAINDPEELEDDEE